MGAAPRGGARGGRHRPVVGALHRARLLRPPGGADRAARGGPAPRRDVRHPRSRRGGRGLRGGPRGDRGGRGDRGPRPDRPPEAVGHRQLGAAPAGCSRRSRRRGRAGVRVDCDVYPYTFAANPLRNLLPLWVQEGGLQAMLGRLREPEIRRRIAREIEERGLTSFGRVPSWDAVSIGTSRTRSRDAGRSLGELARAAGVAPIDLVCDLLAADEGATYVAVFSIDEADVRALLRSPAVLRRLGRPGGRAGQRGRAGPAAPALLRHVPAGARPLRARSRLAVAPGPRCSR